MRPQDAAAGNAVGYDGGGSAGVRNAAGSSAGYEVAGSGDAAAPALVGVVIKLPEPLAGELRSCRASVGDPMAAVVPPHITLVTTTPAYDWAATLAHVRRVAREQCPFEVMLQGSGTFRPVSPVVYVNVARGFDECVRLHRKLQSGPLERETEFGFYPHVTVAHDVSEAGMESALGRLADYEATFTVSSMGLYEHQGTGVWKLREELGFGQDTHYPPATQSPAAAGPAPAGPAPTAGQG